MYEIKATYTGDGATRSEQFVTLEGSMQLADSLATLCPDWTPTVLVKPGAQWFYPAVEYMVMSHKLMNDTHKPVVFVTVTDLDKQEGDNNG